MVEEAPRRSRYDEAFWRPHHEAWKRSDLNQREYCEAQGLSPKAFGNWRAKFKAEPQPAARKLLYRRGGASHTPSHGLSHVAYPSCPSCRPSPGPIVPPARAPSATFQRSRPTPYPRRGERPGCQRIGGRAPLRH